MCLGQSSLLVCSVSSSFVRLAGTLSQQHGWPAGCEWRRLLAAIIWKCIQEVDLKLMNGKAIYRTYVHSIGEMIYL
jgi:hypothetical protein